ncbi:MAG TPA: phosphatidylserine decarboxylase [Roseiflexaceae bacterium]|nr:phosphatidylserine decarboxylase [Roseiflexaceae bacterium]
MTLQEKLYFVQSLRGAFTSVGALLPTSIHAARAMASEFARRNGPRTVLEVGPGTGAITRAIVEAMRPGDRLVLCELHEPFVEYLRQRFEQDPEFRRVRDQVTIIHGDVTQLDRNQRFDAIVSAIPFTNLPAELVEAILETYRAILSPGGTLTYIEYAYLRTLKGYTQTPEERDRSAAASAVLDRFLARYEFRRDTVVLNVPPAWVHHLRLSSPAPSDAQVLAPAENHRRVRLGPLAISTEALPWLGGLLALRVLLGGRAGWPLALVGTALAAFFRDPPRAVTTDHSLAYAACDGRVLAVERLHDERLGAGEWLRIAVFLSLADVHINRSPVAGRVADQIRLSGGFAAADSGAAEHNQTLYTLIDGPRGRCVVAQRTGLVARRIVSWVQPGALLAQGDRYGLIRFGSRTDVYLLADTAAPLVSVGDRVTGGVTPIARFV